MPDKTRPNPKCVCTRTLAVEVARRTAADLDDCLGFQAGALFRAVLVQLRLLGHKFRSSEKARREISREDGMTNTSAAFSGSDCVFILSNAKTILRTPPAPARVRVCACLVVCAGVCLRAPTVCGCARARCMACARGCAGPVAKPLLARVWARAPPLFSPLRFSLL